MFVNQPLQQVQEIADCCRLDYVQLHGDETPEYCRLINRPVIKAFRVGNNFNAAKIEAYQVDWLLLDSFVAGQAGGTGVAFDWQRTRELIRPIEKPILVAGGLTPENVAEAIRILTPRGVDVSGGVETNGIKDSEKIRRFITAARAAQEGKDNA